MICPCCGLSIERDVTVNRDGWEIDPRGVAKFRGRPAVHRASWVNILHSLASEGGRVLSTPALLARISDSERDNTLASQISQLKAYLRSSGLPVPIASRRGIHGSGYFWNAA